MRDGSPGIRPALHRFPVKSFLSDPTSYQTQGEFLLPEDGPHVIESAQMKRWVLITLALGALIIGYRQLPSTSKGWFGTDDTISATGTPVNRELMLHVVRERAQLQAVEVVDVFSPVAGRLNKVQLKAGDKVAKGQTLATVRSDELLQRVEKISAALEAAKADLRQKESRLAEAEKVLDRAHELHSRDLIPGEI